MYMKDLQRRLTNNFKERQHQKPMKNLTKDDDESTPGFIDKKHHFLQCRQGWSLCYNGCERLYKEAERQLMDESFYKTLPSDPTSYKMS